MFQKLIPTWIIALLSIALFAPVARARESQAAGRSPSAGPSAPVDLEYATLANSYAVALHEFHQRPALKLIRTIAQYLLPRGVGALEISIKLGDAEQIPRNLEKAVEFRFRFLLGGDVLVDLENPPGIAGLRHAGVREPDRG